MSGGYRERLQRAHRELLAKRGKLEHPRNYGGEFHQVGRGVYVERGDLTAHHVLTRELAAVGAKLAG